MNRGSLIVRLLMLIRSCGFNEAPIHESGKCVQAGLPTVKANRLQ